MLSAASTVIVFCMPGTVRLVQRRVIVTVLVIPLTVTMLSLQATVLFWPMPEMVRLLPGGGAGGVAGAVEVDGRGVRVWGGAGGRRRRATRGAPRWSGRRGDGGVDGRPGVGNLVRDEKGDAPRENQKDNDDRY